MSQGTIQGARPQQEAGERSEAGREMTIILSQLKVLWASTTRREKLMVVLVIISLFYAIFKQPQVKTITDTKTVTVTVDRWHNQTSIKDWLVVHGLVGSVLRILPDGTYEIMGPFDLTSTRTSDSVTDSSHSSTTISESHTLTEPAVAWRGLIKASVMVPLDKPWNLNQASWSLGGAAHLGQLSLFKLKFDIGGGGEVWKTADHTYVGPMLLVSF